MMIIRASRKSVISKADFEFARAIEKEVLLGNG